MQKKWKGNTEFMKVIWRYVRDRPFISRTQKKKWNEIQIENRYADRFHSRQMTHCFNFLNSYNNQLNRVIIFDHLKTWASVYRISDFAQAKIDFMGTSLLQSHENDHHLFFQALFFSLIIPSINRNISLPWHSCPRAIKKTIWKLVD